MGPCRPSHIRWALLAIVIGSLSGCSGKADIGEELSGGSRAGTGGGREALFDQILDMTENREAFSPLKEEAMGYSPLDEMRSLRSEVVDVKRKPISTMRSSNLATRGATITSR